MNRNQIAVDRGGPVQGIIGLAWILSRRTLARGLKKHEAV